MKIFKQKMQELFFYQKCVHLGVNTFKHCSRITVVHVHVNVFFSKMHTACHSDATGIKSGINQND